MDRRLLVGIVAAVLLGGIMGKRATKNKQWVVYAEYYGGPSDGEEVDLGCVGPDPVRAFVFAVERDDIPERIQKHGHWYEVDWTSLGEVHFGAGEDDDIAASVSYVYEGYSG